MGIIGSKQSNDNYNLYNESIIDVLFCQLNKTNEFSVSPEQLNALLGLNIPKYAIFEGTQFPYVFCVSSLTDINNISKEYGYEVGYITKQSIFKHEFSASHKVSMFRGNYTLERVK